MARAFGIVTSSGTHIKVEGLQQYRPIGAFSFLGRYRVIDFPISNMSNSGIDRIQKITGNFFRHILIPVLISHSCIILWTMQEKNS